MNVLVVELKVEVFDECTSGRAEGGNTYVMVSVLLIRGKLCILPKLSLTIAAQCVNGRSQFPLCFLLLRTSFEYILVTSSGEPLQLFAGLPSVSDNTVFSELSLVCTVHVLLL